MSRHYFRFHQPHLHHFDTFGGDVFGKRAEWFARAFGTPSFLLGQTAIVIAWITCNAWVGRPWDPYPFILLNLGFSLQAAYAAPLILLAQTRQADRDKALADADAAHRESLATASLERNDIALRQGEKLEELLLSNTRLTEQTARLAERLEELTRDMHGRICT